MKKSREDQGRKGGSISEAQDSGVGSVNIGGSSVGTEGPTDATESTTESRETGPLPEGNAIGPLRSPELRDLGPGGQARSGGAEGASIGGEKTTEPGASQQADVGYRGGSAGGTTEFAEKTPGITAPGEPGAEETMGTEAAPGTSGVTVADSERFSEHVHGRGPTEPSDTGIGGPFRGGPGPEVRESDIEEEKPGEEERPPSGGSSGITS